MRLNTPDFWYDSFSASGVMKAAVLSPLSLVYCAGHKLHQAFTRSYKPSATVICIGNVVAGGSGKTPVALAVADLLMDNHLADNDKKICFLSRGYGGRIKGPVMVRPETHTYTDVGDEPLLLAAQYPTIVSKNRAAGVRLAEKSGFNIVIMDDGLQNPTVEKTTSLLVIDGRRGIGNNRLLPAGPLRESLSSGLSKCAGVIIVGDDKTNLRETIREAGVPVFQAALKLKDTLSVDTNTPCIGFTGLGDPEKFRQTLIGQTINLVGWHTYPDHYPYTPKDMASLESEAEEKNARLITTAKDMVRLPAEYMFKAKPMVVPVHIDWTDDKDRLAHLLLTTIRSTD